ncbi:MAG: M3 family metallopeptidase [Burkholderiaceae bacterium]
MNKPRDNPLLEFAQLTRFDAIRPEHVGSAVEYLLAAARETIARLEGPHVKSNWSDFIEPLETTTERLARVWKAVEHLNSVADSPALRSAYHENLPLVTQFWTSLSHNPLLFAKYRDLAQSTEFAGYSEAKKRVVEHALRDFELAGAALPDAAKREVETIQQELAILGQRFSENELDATKGYALWIDSEEHLRGMPPEALAAARMRAEKEGRGGYKITLQTPSYLAVMQFAERRTLRQAVYEANAKRASEFGPPSQDNTDVILRTLTLRSKLAKLLGFSSFSELSLVPKMAETPKQVMDFLKDFAHRARPYAKRDLAELRRFARSDLGINELEAWDALFAAEKLREKRFGFSEQQVKEYFPEPRVLEGLFGLVERLFSIQIKPDQAPAWHPDVRFFRIESRAGELVAQFYLDLYARPNKRSGAWMDDARARRRIGNRVQTPIAFLTCNFSEPVAGRPTLLSHDEVITLFHEFGHGLHHMLTRVEELPVSGIHGVEWDAVELPSQFLENFCWEWDVLKHITGHVDTGQPLPKALFDQMLAARNFQSGMQTLRQIEFGLFDMLLHTDFDPAGNQSVQQLLDGVRDRVAVFKPPAYNRFQNHFSHIFSGGYAAGYYSYKWAEVLAADAYAKFEEEGVLNPDTGTRFRDEILGVGGTRPALESFKSFRGREPTLDALLRHTGMVEVRGLN